MAATNLFRSALLCLFLVSYIGILPVNQLQDLPLQDQIEYPYQISQVLTSVNISGSTGFHRTGRAICVWRKHGFVSLSIPGHDPPIEITMYMDVATNPAQALPYINETGKKMEP